MAEGEIPPAAIADAVVAAKALLRLEGVAEDALLATLAGSAILLAEAFTGQRLIARGFADTVAVNGVWQRLQSAPVTVISPVVASPWIAIDIDEEAIGWVRLQPGSTDRVAVSYTAGLAAAWAQVPAPIAQGVALLVQHLFEHREGDVAPPAAVTALWRPWRRVRIGTARRTGCAA